MNKMTVKTMTGVELPLSKELGTGDRIVLKQFGCSEIGPLHKTRQLPNQDAFCHHTYPWGELIALSDGLGSHALSQLGSQAACDAALRLLEQWHQLPELSVTERLTLFHQNWLENLAEQDITQCGCTILMVLRLDTTLFWAQLGDGLSVLYRRDVDQPECLTASSELFSNQTYALKANFSLTQWQTDSFDVQECRGIFLCSDGIADDLELEQQSAFFKQLYIQYRHLPELQIIADMQQWLQHWPVPGHSDDKTLVAMIVKDAL
jgi:serine/threonine protein phosphatase PrpC